jgi:hypothetical protein
MDEFFADFQLIGAGGERFQEIVAAPRLFMGRVEKHDPAWWRAQEMICLGGGGDWSDEHRDGGAERLRGTSASKLTLESLYITDPVVVSMAEEVNHFDSHVGCPKSHLASIIKMAKIKMPGSDLLNYKTFLRIIEAIFVKMKKNLSPTKREPTFGDFVMRMMQNKSSYEDDEALTGLVKLVEEESTSGNPLIFSARHVFESLWRTAPGETMEEKLKAELMRGKTLLDMMLFLVDVLYWDQIHFHSYRREAGLNDFEGWFGIDVWDGSKVQRIKAAAVQTDNPQAHNALRSLGACLSIVKTNKGNVTILGNIKQAAQLKILRAMDEGVQNLIAMNRYMDLPIGERQSVVWSTLQARGNSPADDKWYLAGDDEEDSEYWLAGYNGTVNHQTDPTTVTRPKLRFNAEHAFDSKKVKVWKQKNGVPQNDWIQRIDLSSWLKPTSVESDLIKALK